MKKNFLTLFSCLSACVIFAQEADIRVYHGKQGESVFLDDKNNSSNSGRRKMKFIRSKDDTIYITVQNPNPFFYKYEINTEDFDIVDDTPDVSLLAEVLNGLLSSQTPGTTSSPFSKSDAATSKFATYQEFLNNLYSDISEAKNYIENSDNPESKSEALDYITNSSGKGFRAASDGIQSLASFKIDKLQEKLDDLLKKAVEDRSLYTSLSITTGDGEKIIEEAYKLLNKNFVTTIDQILKIAKEDRIIRFKVPVKENKRTEIRLVISKIDKKGSRDLIDDELATVSPRYHRATLELVPVANVIYYGNRQKFIIDNDIVRSAPDDGFTFKVGTMLLYNVSSFGKYGEGAVSIGLGYNIPKKGVLDNLYLGSLISYKNIFRIGLGIGFNSYPAGLKDGAKVDQPLPANISNIDDVIDYQRKIAGFITISVSGLSLGGKK